MSIDRKIGLELGRGPEVGRDPRQMTAEELVALGHTPMSPLKALRLRCIDCFGGCVTSVRCCTATDCPSWPFRLGHSPWRKELSQKRKEQLRRLVGVALAGGEALDGSNRHSAVRDAAVLTPGGQRGEQSTRDV